MKTLLATLTIFLATNAMADSLVCANQTIFYRATYTVGGPAPIQGSMIGQSLLQAGGTMASPLNQIVDQEQQLAGGQTESSPACTVTFDELTKVAILTPNNPGGIGTSVYTISMTATCSSGPNAGQSVAGVLTCTRIGEIAP